MSNMDSPITYPHIPDTRRRACVLAADHHAGYGDVPAGPAVGAADGTHGHRDRARPPERATDPSAPFGLPVLAELPELSGVLQRLDVADRAMLDAVVGLARLLDHDEVATTSGVPVETWIASVTRHTRLDRRLLLRAARWLTRLPSLATAATTGAVSWPQLRGLTLTLAELPAGHDHHAERWLATHLPHLEPDADPDALLGLLARTIAGWAAQASPPPEPVPATNRLVIQPTLDGTRGRIHGDYDATGLALLDDATAPTRHQLEHPGGAAGARADNLLTRLTHTCPDPHASRDDTGDGDAGDGAGAGAGGGGGGGGGGPFGGGLGPVQLLLRAELDTLLGHDLPVELLTRLSGGRLRITAPAARRLLERYGARVRTILTDHGSVIGVGRATRIPPGYLRDAALAVHDTCTGPYCTRPARGAELDHAVPWHPAHPDQPPGHTDHDNLGPLCDSTNRAKEAAGWRATQHPDGRRRWHHPRTGLTITTIPTTWRPPPPTPTPTTWRPPPTTPTPTGTDPP
jgi:hypothetical protein